MTCRLLAIAFALGLAGCGKPAAPPATDGMTDAQLNAEVARCRGLGLKYYDDPACRAAQQARTDRFFGKPSGAVR